RRRGARTSSTERAGSRRKPRHCWISGLPHGVPPCITGAPAGTVRLHGGPEHRARPAWSRGPGHHLAAWPHREHIRMNKTELIEAVAEVSDLTKAEATRAVDAVISSITKALKKGDAVTLVGFGTFQVRKRAARTGRNPKTGDTITIAASNNPAFKAGKALKDAVN